MNRRTAPLTSNYERDTIVTGFLIDMMSFSCVLISSCRFSLTTFSDGGNGPILPSSITSCRIMRRPSPSQVYFDIKAGKFLAIVLPRQ